MKATIIEPKKETLTFPCLKVSRARRMVVLFSEMHAGTVLQVGNTRYEIGYHSSVWDSAESDTWEPFTGKIELEN
jgi:hypothetical protein